jgi:predicted GH43/DUF377 family glycosyl hydrolase
MNDNKNILTLIPISLGELIDKITILEIKSKKIKNNDALNNVNKELNYLIDIYNNVINDKSEISKLKIKLNKINLKLWEVEDNLRMMELTNQFNSEFIEEARSVYKLNDKRASIKKEINILLKSEIIEEKSYSDLNGKW